MTPLPGRSGNVLPSGPPPDPRAAVAVAVANRRRRAEVRASLRRREIGWRALLALADQDPAVVGRLFVGECVRDMRGRATPPSIAIQMHKLHYDPRLRLSGMGPKQRALVKSWWP